jgi:hypothetical protein
MKRHPGVTKCSCLFCGGSLDAAPRDQPMTHDNSGNDRSVGSDADRSGAALTPEEQAAWFEEQMRRHDERSQTVEANPRGPR